MKIKLFLVIHIALLASGYSLYAQCDFSLETFPEGAYIRQVTDYGATPNDDSDNDYYAIVKAVEEVQRFINANPGYYGIVLFPEGRYDIGEIIDGEMKFHDFANLIPVVSPSTYTYSNGNGTFSNVRNMKIMGLSSACDKPVIRYKNGFKYGVEDDELAQIPSVFRFMNSANLMIMNLEIDGNSENHQYIGWPHNQYPNHTGIALYSPFFNDPDYRFCIEINDCYIHSFGYDGLYLQLSYHEQAEYLNGIIKNTTISNCGRQNLTFINGRNVRIVNSTFRHAGKFNLPGYDNDYVHPETNNPYVFHANANVQIEPNPNYKVINVVFDSCNILYDVTGRGPSLGIAGGLPHQHNIKNIVFNDCDIRGHQSSAEILFTGNRDFEFNNCNFEGSFLANSTSPLPILYPDELTRFNTCTFKAGAHTSNGWNLVWSRGQMKFTDCEFYTNIHPIYNNSAPESMYDTIIDSRFIYDFSVNHAYNLPRSFFANVFFKGKNKFVSAESCVPQTTSANKNEDVQNFIVAGSNDPSNPHEMNIHSGYRAYASRNNYGKMILGQYPCESLNVYIGDGFNSYSATLSNTSDLYHTYHSDMYINEGTVVIVKKGGVLRLGGNTFLSGKIIVENGGRIHYVSGHSIFYPLSSTGADIVMEAGAIASGVPNSIAIADPLLQPPSNTLITPNSCVETASEMQHSSLYDNDNKHVFQVFPNPNPEKKFNVILGDAYPNTIILITDINGKEIKAVRGDEIKVFEINLENELNTSSQVILFTLYVNGEVWDTKKVIYKSL